MEANPSLVKGTFSLTFSAFDSKRLWEELALQLNSCPTGPTGKSVDEWKKVSNYN